MKKPRAAKVVKDTRMFAHSKCCNSHWELAVDTKTGAWVLECEQCGKGIGPSVQVTGPNMSGCSCADCGKGGGK